MGPWPEAVLTAIREAGVKDEDRERVDTDPTLLAQVAALVIDAARRMAAALATTLKLILKPEETPEKVLVEGGFNPADYKHDPGQLPTGEFEECFMSGVPGGNRESQIQYFKGLGYKVNPSPVLLARKRKQPKADGKGPVAYLGDSWVRRRPEWRRVAYLDGRGGGQWDVRLADANPDNTFDDNWRFSVSHLLHEIEAPVLYGSFLRSLLTPPAKHFANSDER